MSFVLGNHNYYLAVQKSVYYQNGKEVKVFVPYLNIQNGIVTSTGSDEIGDFEFTGNTEDNYFT